MARGNNARGKKAFKGSSLRKTGKSTTRDSVASGNPEYNNLDVSQLARAMKIEDAEREVPQSERTFGATLDKVMDVADVFMRDRVEMAEERAARTYVKAHGYTPPSVPLTLSDVFECKARSIKFGFTEFGENIFGRMAYHLWAMRGLEGPTGDVFRDWFAYAALSPSCYYVEKEVMDLVHAASQQLDEFTLYSELFKTPTGFMGFRNPIELEEADDDGQPSGIKWRWSGFAWYVLYDGDTDPDKGEFEKRVHYTASTKEVLLAHHEVKKVIERVSLFMLADIDLEYRMAPISAYHWVTNITYSDMQRIIGDRWDPSDTVQLRFIFAILQFMNQVLIVPTEPALPNKRSIELAEQELSFFKFQAGDTKYVKDYLKSGVRTIKLRAVRHVKSTHGDEGDQKEIDWQCRWMVAGHWHTYHYGKDRAESRMKFLLPYIKGPSEKPLKVPDFKVFNIER